jgi:uncharacterized protein with von Willebrand factor type A (vWA) domain
MRDTHPNRLEGNFELTLTLIEFGRFLREHGFNVGPDEILGCREAIALADPGNSAAWQTVLRAVVCSTKREWDLFPNLFAEFWQTDSVRQSVSRRAKQQKPSVIETRATGGLHVGVSDLSGESLSEKQVNGASPLTRLRQIDFGRSEEMPELQKLAERLLRQLSLRLARILEPDPHRGPIHFRRTIRRNLGAGGELIALQYRHRPRRKARLVVLLDVSDSMNAYSIFLLRFMHVLRRTFRDVSGFIFSTGLEPIDGALRARTPSEMFAQLGELVAGWSGGTKIGASLQEFNLRYARGLLTPETAVIVLSDGWDTGGPELLVTELRSLRARIARLIWLNPLLGLPGYQPVTRAMSAALPLIDVFASAHNLDSLLQLEHHLRPKAA